MFSISNLTGSLQESHETIFGDFHSEAVSTAVFKPFYDCVVFCGKFFNSQFGGFPKKSKKVRNKCNFLVR